VIPKVPIGTPGYHLEEFAKWISQPPINYHLGVDGISLFLVILTTFLTPISVLASWNSIEHRVKRVFPDAADAGKSASVGCSSHGSFPLLPLLEVMLIRWLADRIWGHERRVYAAVKFILYTMAGSIFMLIASSGCTTPRAHSTCPRFKRCSALQPRKVALSFHQRPRCCSSGLLCRVCDQGAAFPAAYLAAGMRT